MKKGTKAASQLKTTLTPREVAAECGFGITHTYKLLQEGAMPAIKIGKRFFVPRNALQRWLDSCGRAAE